jgi:DsbC/DsbD-like thiol-disulfide interchange protein
MKMVLPFILAALLTPLPAKAAKANDLVHATLLADVSAIQPGKPFNIGVLFKIEPGWHIYWKNPGDSGLATKVKLDLPPGFTAGDVQYPIPTKLDLPGNIVNYAYENEVMLIVPITPPKDLAVGSPVTITANAKWLVCNDVCLPGSGKLSASLKSESEAVADNTSLFEQWHAALPITNGDPYISHMASGLKLTASNHVQMILDVTWKTPATDVRWFPENENVQNVKVDTTASASHITFEINKSPGDSAFPKSADSLLVFNDGDGHVQGIRCPIKLNLSISKSVGSQK